MCWNCNEVGHVQRQCPKKRVKPSRGAALVEEEFYESNGEGAFVTSTSPDGNWLIDSGASSHMTHKREYFTDFKEFDRPEKVHLGDGRVVEAVGVGNIRLKMTFKVSSPRPATVYDVLYVPRLTCNLFSVRAATKRGNQVKFGPDKCWVRDSNGQLRGMGKLVGKLYQLECKVRLPAGEHVSVAVNNDLWHQRLGHLNSQQLHRMVDEGHVSGIKLSPLSNQPLCEGCIMGKMHRKPFKPVDHKQSTKKLELVHSDVCGPMQVESIGGSRYFATFIDDYTHLTSVYFMKHKSEVLKKFQEFEAAVTNECGERVVKLRTDNGGEYMCEEYLKSKGIQHELTVAYTPQQNGIAERMNRTLMESARSMMSHAHVTNRFWAEAVATASYLRNRSPTTAVEEGKTPYEKWHGRRPDLEHIRVFGCAAYAHIPDCKRKKLDNKAEKLRFVGYSPTSKGYRLYSEHGNKMLTRRDVTFDETNFLLGPEKTQPGSLEALFPADVNPPEEVEEAAPEVVVPEQQTRRSDRAHNPPDRYGSWVSHIATCEHFAYNVCQVSEPKTIDEALAGPHAREWKAAAESEYKALMENDTWDLVELPEGRQAVGSKWVFKVKHDSCGRIERFKGRLVAKGYSQKYGIDFEETFAPVVRFSSVRALLAFGVSNNMIIHQMDVVTAFLMENCKRKFTCSSHLGMKFRGRKT